MGCLFCQIVDRKVPADVVFENAHALAFRDIRPVAPTHVLVVPKRHVGGARDIGAGDVELAGQVLHAARTVAKELGLESSGYRLVINDGEAAGQSVHHLHVHVIGGRTLAWPPG